MKSFLIILNKLVQFFLDMLFPLVVIKNAPLFTAPLCLSCRARLPYGKKVCHKSEPLVLYAATEYSGEVKKYIWELKYNKKQGAIQPLGAVVRQFLNNLSTSHVDNKLLATAIVPVPITGTRRNERGFNQAELIAEVAAEALGLPIYKDALVKRHHTKPQAELHDRSARMKNLKEAFSVKNSAAIQDRHILLVDDVATTGTTLRECARALKKVGAKSVTGLVLATVR